MKRIGLILIAVGVCGLTLTQKNIKSRVRLAVYCPTLLPNQVRSVRRSNGIYGFVAVIIENLINI